MTNELTKPKSRKKRRPYPPKYRAERSQLIQTQQPWKQSTGPRSATGRETAARNAYKHGFRSRDMARVRELLKMQREYVKMAVFKAFSGG